MSVRFENFDHSFVQNGKHFFKPSAISRKIGADIKAQIEDAYKFDTFVYHMRQGGHVAAIHSHRVNSIFCRLDIERFFYGIGRNRVMIALRSIGLARAEHYAKWSTVKNPYEQPSYALPYGFVQSPIIATLVLMTSSVGEYLRALPDGITASVYMDDVVLSGNETDKLELAFNGLLANLPQAGFQINAAKLRMPSASMDVFNCDLTIGGTTVREERKAEFYSAAQSDKSVAAFERYCESIENGNAAL
ncbi:reverse transcriptase domain-containing protein [Neorhizobium galegae]|uniref:reverse transcriptase domain-containing protein n=1 Tax=Neorhizobium galegae TaxID=399 RepID=UPI000621C66B|nr:reverse transcriptase domain-containing protein [Neorhizobium galegae]KAB1126936.1 hypothetical protein F4V90_07590 [Neorhizobium galegae]MCQ1808621.1 reverse transcriptase domain-containing protein [Neorhizobium galegae]CDZ57164.1 Reverse transcriptase family protein [Neorhizobium galegae bv. orientalis]